MKRFSELKEEAKGLLKPKFWEYFGVIVSIPLALYLIILLEDIIFGDQELIDSILMLIINIITVPLAVGVIYITVQFVRGNEFGIKQWFVGYKKFWRVFWTIGVKGFLIGVWYVLPMIMIMGVIIPQAEEAIGMGLFKQGLHNAVPPTYISVFESIISTLFTSSIGLITIALFIAAIVISTIVSLAYVMVEYILAEKPELTWKQVLRLSKTMMKGQKTRFLLFNLSFIGWILLSGVTFGIALIWVLPYIQVAQVLFYEGINERYEEMMKE
ncbi:MAG TPA: hypothetical protein DCP90_07420 [Clostridiales bacterium]|nr:MAG: hypothetical protein A2Y22_03555 [Clostridiales bacterium GWD2_32_59]HAN10427.1 hypothetical protein [Clostridiales bacterium]